MKWNFFMISPHWWILVNKVLSDQDKNEILERLSEYKKIIVTDDDIVDIKNIAFWAYSPIEWYLRKDDFESVIKNIRTKKWDVWPIPIILSIDEDTKDEIRSENDVILVSSLWNPVAVMKDIEVFDFDKTSTSMWVFWVSDEDHPWVGHLCSMNEYLIWWELFLIDSSSQTSLEQEFTPQQTRDIFVSNDWDTIVAFQTRNPPHRSHEYLQKCALEQVDWLFVSPVVWKKKPWDFRDEFILWAYERLIGKYYHKDRTHLWVIPLAMRYAWPREAIFHALIRKNYWCSHMIIWRDHAWVGDYYWPYDAQDIFRQFPKEDIWIEILKFDNAGHCNECGHITSAKTCHHPVGDKVHISWTKLREMIRWEDEIPHTFMRKEVSVFLKNWKDRFH